MKQIYLLIGIMMALVLCISPVGGFTGEDFRIIIEDSDKLNIHTYTYQNWAYVNEKYFKIYTGGTRWLCSCVTFKPANISDAPTMVVDTSGRRYISLPRSVDEWEIKYYSQFSENPHLNDEYLKNAGVVNLKLFFGEYNIENGLYMVLDKDQSIEPTNYKGETSSKPIYYIPDVDRG